MARSGGGLSIMKDMKLPAWAGNIVPVWPPWRPLGAQVAAMYALPAPPVTPEQIAARDAALKEEAERVAEFYLNQERRREECEAAARFFSERLPGVRALRDVTAQDLAEFGGQLPAKIRKRARHVINENARVQQAAEALKNKDLIFFGRLMADSHASLRDDFEVSCEELDLMVRLAAQNDGVYGARMTGGGFGGCAVALVRADHVEQFKSTVAAEYEQVTGRAPELYVSSAADGAATLL